MKKLLSLVAAFLLSANLFAATQVEGGVGNLVVPKTYSNIGAWGGTWSGNQVANEKDWSAYEYVWIKYSGFEGALNFGVMYSEFKSHESWGDAYYDATVSPKDPSGVVGIKLDNTTKYTLGNKEEDGDYIGDIYAQHIREVFIQATSNGTNITIEEMWLGTEEEYNQAVEDNKWVEVFVPDTEDPGVKAIPEGYMSLITNGTMEESDDVSSFFTKVNKGAPAPSVITEGVGRFNGHGITITSIDNASDGWDTQFWLMFNKPISSGTKIHIEFDYRSTELTSVSTQQHGATCNYIDYRGLNGFSPSLNWKHFEQDFTTTADMQSIAFNLNDTKDEAITFYFDNFLAYTEIPPTNWIDLLADADEDETFFKTEQGIGGPWAVSPEDGVYSVLSADDPALDWDTQFFVRLPKKLPQGTKYRVSFDYKASQAGDADTQAHFEPGAYKHYVFIGSPSFTTDWQTYGGKDGKEGAISSDQDGIYTIAFNLAKNKKETTFSFKNFKFEVPEDQLADLEDAPSVPDYLFTPENPAITIETQYATIVPDYSMDIEGCDITAYSVAYDADKACVALTEITEIPYKQAVLVYAEGGAGTYDAASIARVLGVETGLNAASTDASKPSKGDGSTIYVLAEVDDVVGFYLLEADAVIPAGKGFLQIPEAEGRAFIGFAGDATTVKAIETLKANGAIYNLAGQQVKNAQKGIFIIDGKKVIK